MSQHAKADHRRQGKPERKKPDTEDRGEAARQGRDVDDFGPNEARSGDPGRESNRGG